MSVKSKQNGRMKNSLYGERSSFYMLATPFLLMFFIFTILPILASLVLSFFSYDMISFPKFNGLNNYLRMVVGDDMFAKVVGNTLKFAVITGPVGYILAFILAWFLNEFSPVIRGILTFLFYVPSLAGNATFIWQTAFSGDSYGYVNSFLLDLGLIQAPVNWFYNESYNTTILIFVTLMLSMGVGFLANIAGLQNVNQELYEAGAIDGISTRWHELWYITLPSMKSILLFSMVMQIQSSFSIGAINSALCGYPSVNNSVDTLILHLADVGTVRYEMGYAAAMSVFLFTIMIFARQLCNKVLDLFGK